jgi:mannose-6-phosphate isomerase
MSIEPRAELQSDTASIKPFVVEKPWGSFRQYTLNEPVTVKTIHINKGETLSLQKHSKRSEFWKVLKGNPTFTIGSDVHEAHEGDEFEVEAGQEHRMAALHDDAVILEISRGEFDEMDIIRLEDKYGRI